MEDQLFKLKHYKHPVSVPPRGLLDSPWKMSNFQKISEVRPENKFSTREATRPIGDDMKTQPHEQIHCANLKIYTPE